MMKKTVILALAAALSLSSFAADGKTKVACIGDSITYGFGLPNRERECYPTQLQKMLDQRFPGQYEVRNFGNSGRGIYLDSKRGDEMRGYRYMPEHKAALEWQPDIVICNLGINDCGEYIKEYCRKRPRGQFVRDYVTLLDDYTRQSPRPKLYIWTKLAPLIEGQRFYRSPEPFLMQRDLGEVARMTGATPIDMQEPLRDAMDLIFAKDKLHPDASGARAIASATFKVLTETPKEPAEIPEVFRSGKPFEVWLCAGQSNMQKGWSEFNATPVEKERVKSEMDRLAKLDIWFWDFTDGSWTKLTPANATRKCAVGVSFAIRRAESTGKSVAILYVAAGGAPTESFLSESTLCTVGFDGRPLYPHLAAIATNRHRIDKNSDFPCEWVAREYPRRHANRVEAYWWPVSKMHDEGIRKRPPLPLTGVLWYQGESNATTGGMPDAPTDPDYQIESLRAIVAQLGIGGRIPFVMIGLPKMNRQWESYRDAQKRVASETHAIFVDTFAAGLGEMGDVHPRDKAAFADLAAKAAEAVR